MATCGHGCGYRGSGLGQRSGKLQPGVRRDQFPFFDPYISMDAGYVQVTRLSGRGPAMIVYPGPGTPFEAYYPILNSPGPDSKKWRTTPIRALSERRFRLGTVTPRRLAYVWSSRRP